MVDVVSVGVELGALDLLTRRIRGEVDGPATITLRPSLVSTRTRRSEGDGRAYVEVAVHGGYMRVPPRVNEERWHEMYL